MVYQDRIFQRHTTTACADSHRPREKAGGISGSVGCEGGHALRGEGGEWVVMKEVAASKGGGRGGRGGGHAVGGVEGVD